VFVRNGSFGVIPKGSPSGRKIGEECYNSVQPQGAPGGEITIVARNGRAVVNVSLHVPVPVQATPGRQWVPANPKDVALVERHLVNVLNRLTTLEKGIKPK
jgi:hypothetical protein